MTNSLAKKVIEANIAVHSRLAAEYHRNEPHFRPENVSRVTDIVRDLIQTTKAQNVLDLGCGTGFMVNIAKPYVGRIVGVDVTQAMLDEVDTSGPARVELHRHDTASFPVKAGEFQLVTAYSFLHHLADLEATFATAGKALARGGKFYADLDPNFYFWKEIKRLETTGKFSVALQREINSVCNKDDEIKSRFGISQEIFNHAEYGKDFSGGFKEDDVRKLLHKAGFASVIFRYHWFLGQADLINSGEAEKEVLLSQARTTEKILQDALPLSRCLFKYIGFVATR